MTEKSSENEIFAKGNNSCKSRSNATKVKLDLYYVKTNAYTKFQWRKNDTIVNIVQKIVPWLN